MTKQPLQHGWNSVEDFPPPTNKLIFYTKAGTAILGKFNEFSPGFVTDWAYLLPSPTKQAGGIK